MTNVETELQKIASFNIGDTVIEEQISNLYLKNNLRLELSDFTDVPKYIDVLEDKVLSLAMVDSYTVFKQFLYAGLNFSIDESQEIVNHLTGSVTKIGPNAHVYLLSTVSKSKGVSVIEVIEEIMELQEEEVKEVQRPSRPDSSTSIAVNNVIKRGNIFQKINLPKSSVDWLGNAYTQINASYTSYQDRLANGSGSE